MTYLFFRCWTLPRHLNLPFTIMAILVHRASHSSILTHTHTHTMGMKRGCPDTQPCGAVGGCYLWEVRTIERPSLMTLWMQFQRARRALGSMPVVGSSCNQDNGQKKVGPEVEEEDEGEGEQQGEEHHPTPSDCSSAAEQTNRSRPQAAFKLHPHLGSCSLIG